MAGKKWKKQIAKNPGSFRRPRGSRRPGNAILIVTEGEVTEPVYFDAIRRSLSVQALEIAIVAAGRGDPRRLAEAALEERRRRKRNARDGRLAFSQAEDFDELWIVFDTDIPLAHGRFHDGIAFANSKGVKSGHSTPCFEFWLLLHFECTTAPMHKCANVKPRLEKAMGATYEKTSQASGKLIPPLIEKLDAARTNAATVRRHHVGAGTTQPANPSTEVDRLIAAIIEAASPANR